MPIATIQPAEAIIADPSGGDGGWGYGIPQNLGPYTDWGITAVAGVRSSGSDVFADSPPIDGEIYLITAFTVGYGAVLNKGGASAPESIEVEFALMVGPDVRARVTDSQPALESPSGDTIFVGTGVFAADLINPIAVSASEIVRMRVGELSIGSGGRVAIGLQASLQAPGNVTSGIPYPSTISYTSLRPTRG